VEIKEELKKQGQNTSGNKGPLLEHLKAAILAGVAVMENVQPRGVCMNHLDLTARWELVPPC